MPAPKLNFLYFNIWSFSKVIENKNTSIPLLEISKNWKSKLFDATCDKNLPDLQPTLLLKHNSLYILSLFQPVHWHYLRKPGLIRPTITLRDNRYTKSMSRDADFNRVTSTSCKNQNPLVETSLFSKSHTFLYCFITSWSCCCKWHTAR